jgi:hypothetical protein
MRQGFLHQLVFRGAIALSSLAIGVSTSHAQVISAPRTIFENVTLSPNFSPDPITVHGISGGEQLASEVSGRADTATGACAGFVDTQPDHTMTLTDYFDYLRLQVQSPDNTMMLVRGPGGSWCNDTYEGVNPGIAGQWFSGTYQIWVGSLETNRYHPYVIRITASPEPIALPTPLTQN